MGQIGEARWREGWRVEGVGGEVRGVLCDCMECEWWKWALADDCHYLCTYLCKSRGIEKWKRLTYLCCVCKPTRPQITHSIHYLISSCSLPPLPSPSHILLVLCTAAPDLSESLDGRSSHLPSRELRMGRLGVRGGTSSGVGPTVGWDQQWGGTSSGVGPAVGWDQQCGWDQQWGGTSSGWLCFEE